MTEDREAALEAAWVEVDRADGTLRPYFAKVQNGFYDRRVVIDSPIIARVLSEEDEPPTVVEWHYEPCRIPRYRTELRWERVQ